MTTKYNIKNDELIDILITRLIIKNKNITSLDKIIFTKLENIKLQHINKKLNKIFPNGIEKFQKSITINYEPLQTLLIKQNFQEADKLTQQYLCQLANLQNKSTRKWLYFTDIFLLPADDLFIIDLLWQIYSNEQFGFFIQRKIWKKNNKNWDIFLNKIGWTNKGIMKRYPNDFIWTINAPKGHLPLFNQLRGTQVLSYLFEHHVWKEYDNN
uniref:GUN4-like domain-containing protein n=1 Tax=Apoglossum ruscifolium TaxID=167976 RepID=A0A4D6WKK4_9FLOR|nr:hypothetical protein [Apoglossum ruscifolium]